MSNMISQHINDANVQIFPHPILMFDDVSEELYEAICGVSNQGNYKAYIYIDYRHFSKISEGYVGVTKREIAKHHNDHIKAAPKNPNRRFYRYLLKNPNAQPLVLACGTQEEISKLEELLRPHSDIGLNIHKGGGASRKGQKRPKTTSRKKQEVFTSKGHCKSRKSARKLPNDLLPTTSRKCHEKSPENDSCSWYNYYTEEPTVLSDDPFVDIQRNINAYQYA